MTLQELCKKYNYAESTVLHNFPVVRSNILKVYKVWINKVGKGQKAEYIEEDRSKEIGVKELYDFFENNPRLKEIVLEGLDK